MKTARYLKTVFSIFGLGLVFACTPQKTKISLAKPKIRVLTYSSFLGEGSLGAWLKAEYAKVDNKVEMVFVEARDEAGLVGELKRSRSAAESIDLVFGLDAAALKRVGADRFTQLQKISSSPMTILIHKDRAPMALKKKHYQFSTWNSLIESGLLKSSVLVQDPRFSSPGFSWLTQSHAVKDSSAKQMHSLVRRVFPSWSSSFGALEKGEGFAIWTYSSSLSYFQCEDKKNPYTELKVDEGYVNSTEFAGVLKDSKSQTSAKSLLSFLLSHEFQQKMVELNWVYPVAPITLPDCYVPKARFSELQIEPDPSVDDINGWIDEWQLF